MSRRHTRYKSEEIALWIPIKLAIGIRVLHFGTTIVIKRLD